MSPKVTVTVIQSQDLSKPVHTRVEEKASKFRGVGFKIRNTRLPWYVRFSISGKTYNIGGFEKELEAASAYDIAIPQLTSKFILNKDLFEDFIPVTFDSNQLAYIQKRVEVIKGLIAGAIKPNRGRTLRDIKSPRAGPSPKVKKLPYLERPENIKLKAEILALQDKGMSSLEISRELNIDTKEFYYIRKRLKIPRLCRSLAIIKKYNLTRDMVDDFIIKNNRPLIALGQLIVDEKVNDKLLNDIYEKLGVCTENHITLYSERECPACHKVFKPKKENAKYCSRGCGRKEWPSSKNNFELRVCYICGVEFSRFKNSKKQYCLSERCEVLDSLGRSKQPITIKNLDKLRSQESRRSKLRARLKARKWLSLQARLKAHTYTERNCGYCKKAFLPLPGKGRRFCCRKCSKTQWTLDNFGRLPVPNKKGPQSRCRDSLKKIYKKGLMNKSLKFKLIERRLNLFGKHVCCFCNKKCDSPSILTVEHLIPYHKAKAKYNWLNNLFCACRGCNSDKSDRDWKKWFRKQPFYSKDRELEIDKYFNLESDFIELCKVKYRK